MTTKWLVELPLKILPNDAHLHVHCLQALLYLVKMFRDLQDSVREEMFAKKYETFYPTTEDQIVLEKHLETGLACTVANCTNVYMYMYMCNVGCM